MPATNARAPATQNIRAKKCTISAASRRHAGAPSGSGAGSDRRAEAAFGLGRGQAAEVARLINIGVASTTSRFAGRPDVSGRVNATTTQHIADAAHDGDRDADDARRLMVGRSGASDTRVHLPIGPAPGG